MFIVGLKLFNIHNMKEKYFLLVLILVFLIPSSLMAAEDSKLYLTLGGFSKHFNNRSNGQKHNEVHNNIGLEYESPLIDDIYFGVSGQYMKNSLDFDSYVATFNLKYKQQINRKSDWGVGIYSGFQNGYPKASKNRDENELIPVAYPIVEFNYDRYGTYFTCVPKVYTSGFCFVGFKFKLYDL